MTKEIKKPLVISKEKRARIEKAVEIDGLGEMIERAKQGEVYASRVLVMAMGHYLYPKVQEPTPPVLRQYMSDAFFRILAGESADVVFNLKKNGRPKTPHKLKLRVSYFVYQGVHEHSLTVEEAVAETIKLINSNSMFWILSQLGGIELQDERVRKWYYETLEELNSIYQED